MRASEIKAKIHKLEVKLGKLRQAYIEEQAALSTMTDSEAHAVARRGRSLFIMSVPDACKVNLAKGKLMVEDRAAGLARFMPLIRVENPTEEYKELFGDDISSDYM